MKLQLIALAVQAVAMVVQIVMGLRFTKRIDAVSARVRKEVAEHNARVAEHRGVWTDDFGRTLVISRDGQTVITTSGQVQ